MSKIFGISTAVLVALSAFLFMKNKGAMEVETQTLTKAEQKATSTKKELASQAKRLNDEDALRQELLAKAEVVEGEIEDIADEHQQAEKEIVSLKSDLTSKEDAVARIDEATASLPDPEELLPTFKKNRAALAELPNSIASEEARLANLLQIEKDALDKIKALRELARLQSSGQSFPTMKTRVSSVYRNWGFVVLAAGDRQGVVTDSILDVVRGEQVIGKLKVTAVEAGRSSASIVLDSVAPGVTIQVGDSVLPEREEAKPATITAAN